MAVSADCFGPYPVWHLIWLFHIRSRESESDHPIIKVTDDNYLVLTMEKKNETKDEDNKKRKYLRREFSYRKFEQSLALPEDVNKDEIKASVNDGVLTIDIPKIKVCEKQPAVKQIEIH